MKLTKLILLFVLAVAAVSCNKDDDDNGPAPYEYNKDNLTGTYKLTYFQSEEIETVNVNGFDVVTTTVSTGDTFDVLTVFASNNIITSDGSYRITETITQGGQTITDAYIVILNNETTGYSVNAAGGKLTIEGNTYDVSNFTPTGFQINLDETTTEPNGDSTVYREEIRFTKE